MRAALREPRKPGKMRCGSGGHMAIISRVPGVALLLVGLTLLSGNARAAEPSYDD